MHIQWFYKSVYLSTITRNHGFWKLVATVSITQSLRLNDPSWICWHLEIEFGMQTWLERYIIARKMRVPRCGYPGESLHLLHRGGSAGAQHSSRVRNTSLHLPFQLKHNGCVNWAALSAQCVTPHPTPIVFGTRDLLRLFYRCTVSGCYLCVLHCKNIQV